MTSGPASILKEPVPAGVLNASAILRPPPERIDVAELMADSIPDAWKNDETNALAIAAALSTQRGLTLPWHTVKSAIDDGIRARWIELSDSNITWPCDFNGAQHVVLQIPQNEKIREDEKDRYQPTPSGTLIAEAALEANGIQDLADQIPEIAKAAIGNSITFNVRIEFSGETPPNPEQVQKINELLSEVSDDLKLT